jgi:D-threo-aldose 1-dehydrogenase
MGASALGNLYQAMTDATATATVARAIEHGIRYFDVAPHYGFGLAERRLGAALRAASQDDILISTKVGRLLEPTHATGVRHGFVDADPFEPVFDYGYDAVLQSHRGSCRRLGVDRVNILLAHDLGRETHGPDAERHERAFIEGGYAAMRELKGAGKIDRIGIGVNEVEVCERLLDRIELDVILLAGRYTLLEQRALGLLDRCAAAGVEVIVGGPFNSGLLVESGGATRHYNYAPAPAALVARAEALASECATFGVPLPAAALAFPLGHPAVSCVLPGFATPQHVDQFATWRDEIMPAALWPGLRAKGLLDPNVPLPV